METPTAPPPKGGGKMWILLGACAVLAVGLGGAVPFFLFRQPGAGDKGAHGDGHHRGDVKRAYVPFGDVVVNLNEERLTRYLRVKMLLVVDADFEKSLAELVTKNKPVLKNWLIGHMSDKSLQEVSGAAGVNKLRREIWREFNAELFPDGSEKIRDIFFEEFVVQ